MRFWWAPQGGVDYDHHEIDTNICQFEIEKSQKQFQALVGPGSKWME
jgi:hypothetical protein